MSADTLIHLCLGWIACCGWLLFVYEVRRYTRITSEAAEGVRRVLK